MARRLTKAVEYRTDLTIFERGKARPVVVGLRPPGIISLRLGGFKANHELSADGLFWHAARVSANGEKEQKS